MSGVALGALLALTAGCSVETTLDDVGNGLSWATVDPSGPTSELQRFDPTPAWPLCGRIAESPPAGWEAADGCPAERFGSSIHTDAPLSSTFGPRLKASEDYRYDFHRGIDLPTPVGTPVFAITDGLVRKAGHDSAYTDALVQLRHFRPGSFGECEPDGCYASNYLHLSDWLVAPGDVVDKGQLIGFTGTSESGFAHLHFEIRDATAEHPRSAWQRHAIHPLTVLPHHESGAANFEVRIDDVDSSVPLEPRVEVTVIVDGRDELDLNRIEVELLRRGPSGKLEKLAQPGRDSVGSTPDGDGYHMHPPWFDMTGWNRRYTHQDSTDLAWSAFGARGPFECPFHADHRPSYDANVHLDEHGPADSHVGVFNGVEVAPAPFNSSSPHYALSVAFTALRGTAIAGELCVRVRAMDSRGNISRQAEWNCQ